MSQEDYLRDISEIKNLMSKSSKFISLSGLSGILAGIYALIGAGYLYFVEGLSNPETVFTKEKVYTITILLLAIGFLTTITTIFFTNKRAKITSEKPWSETTKNLIYSFFMPFCIGLIFMLILYLQENYKHLIAIMLLFYGISLINSKKNTTNIVKPLGLLQVVTGLLCAIYYQYSFWFFVIGFGIIHIVYGTIIYFKYDKK